MIYQKLKSFGLILVALVGGIFCNVDVLSQTQTPSPTPCRANANSNCEPNKVSPENKSIHIQSFLGPFGKAYIPPELLQNASFAPSSAVKLPSDDYIFPSIYFLISAKPNITIKSKTPKGDKFIDYEFSRVGQDLEWIRISFTLEPIYCSNQDNYPKDKDPKPIKILALVPENTNEVVEASKVAKVAEVGEQLVTKLTPFIPVGVDKFTAGAEAANILFSNLFPPKAVAYSYAFADRSDKFGWYWKRKDLQNNPESLVGLRRGVALLQAYRGIKGVKIKYRIDAKWSSDYSDIVDDEYADEDFVETNLYFGDEETNTCKQAVVPKFYDRQNYETLENLNGFPMVVPMEYACKILRIDNCENWITNIYKGNEAIKIIENSDKSQKYILREDLKKILRIEEKKKEEQKP